MNNTKILNTEYGSYNEDVIKFFKNRLNEGKKSVILDPMAGTAPLIPFIEKKGYTAYFNDILPLHFFINKAKTYEIYQKYIENGSDWYIQELLYCMSYLKNKKSIISDKWIDDDILHGLIQAWKKANDYEEHSATLLKAVILLGVRSFSSITESKNPTWLKRGGMTSNKNIKEIITDNLTKFYKFYEHHYGSNSISNKGKCIFLKIDANKIILPQKVDLIFTSPWYCNRIDPLIMYAPENYFLSALGYTFPEYDLLSTPRVRYYKELERDFKYLTSKSDFLDEFLNNIKDSSNPDDPGYYLKYYTRYFAQLWEIMDKITSHLSAEGKMYIVLQDNIHRGELIEIDKVLRELFINRGLKSRVVKKWERHHLGLRNISRSHAFVKPRHYEKIMLIKH